MVDPKRSKLSGRVEVDETTVPSRTVNDPVAGGQGRSLLGKLPIICAVELIEGRQAQAHSSRPPSRSHFVRPNSEVFFDNAVLAMLG